MNGVKDACKRSSNPLPLFPSPQEWINKAGIVHKKIQLLIFCYLFLLTPYILKSCFLKFTLIQLHEMVKNGNGNGEMAYPTISLVIEKMTLKSVWRASWRSLSPQSPWKHSSTVPFWENYNSNKLTRFLFKSDHEPVRCL